MIRGTFANIRLRNQLLAGVEGGFTRDFTQPDGPQSYIYDASQNYQAAGIPLVILAGTLASYNLPLEGVTLILGVDAVMDMARTSVNVVGNCLATVVITKWEGEYDENRMQVGS